jgi:cytochrome P450
MGDAAVPDAFAPEDGRLDLGDPDFPQHAFERYAALRAACPVHRALLADSTLGSVPAPLRDRPLWAVTGYDATVAALVDERLSVDPRTGFTAEDLAAMPGGNEPETRVLLRTMLSLDPPEHTRLRKLVQPSFTARAIAAWAPRIQQIADRLLDAAEAEAAARGETAPRRGLELVSAYAYPLPIAVIFELLGIPESDRSRVHGWTEDLFRSGLEPDGRMAAGMRAFAAYGRELVAAKTAAPGEDLLTQLVHAAQDGDSLDQDELVAMIFLLILAGHVTTVNLIASAAYALLTHPDQRALLADDPDLVDGAIEETLRCWGPAELASERYALEDLELSGIDVRRGDLVLPILAAADRDPARFADPDRFDLARPDARRHLAFGKGVHACLGAPLARLEGRIAVGTLFRRCPDLRLAVPAEQIRQRAMPLRGIDALPLTY